MKSSFLVPPIFGTLNLGAQWSKAHHITRIIALNSSIVGIIGGFVAKREKGLPNLDNFLIFDWLVGKGPKRRMNAL